jgi:hypothetical protein
MLTGGRQALSDYNEVAVDTQGGSSSPYSSLVLRQTNLSTSGSGTPSIMAANNASDRLNVDSGCG